MIQSLRESSLEHDISLNGIFDGDHCDPFSNLRNAYQQKQFIANNLPYVVCLYFFVLGFFNFHNLGTIGNPNWITLDYRHC